LNSKSKTEAELLTAIELAYKEDDEIIIESFLVLRFLLVLKGEIGVVPITEIVSRMISSTTKQNTKEKSQEITPARISDEMTQKLQP
jgi:D-alanine-D-alanine ligase